jgi:hypothetical protein
MSSGADYFLKKTLGEDFFESLTKFELWKPGTRTTVDHEEIKTALMIVPRTVMALLIRELTPMNIGETKEFQLHVGKTSGAHIKVTKHERDVYSGDILEDSKIVVDFKYRSIPGVGLIIMSAFELYDTEKLSEHHKDAPSEDISKKVQHLIDERLALHDLIGKVVDRKIEQRDAIKQLILAKISEGLPVKDEPKKEEPKAMEPDPEHFVPVMENPYLAKSTKKESPLKNFLEHAKNKTKPAEFSIQMSKGEHVDCPDCGKNIFDGQLFSGCICLGDDRDKKIYIKKTEEGAKIRFGRGWDPENIEMLLEVLRRKRG